MIKLYDGGVYLVNGTDIVEDGRDAAAVLTQKQEARQQRRKRRKRRLPTPF